MTASRFARTVCLLALLILAVLPRILGASGRDGAPGARVAVTGDELFFWRGAETARQRAAGWLDLATPGAGEPLAYSTVAYGEFAQVEAQFQVRFTGRPQGIGFALVNTRLAGRTGPGPKLPVWERPNLPRALAVGLKTLDPPNRNWFDPNGNIYDRPQHEVSLHWNGHELANALSPVAYEDGRPHRVLARVRFVSGGGVVTVSIDGQAVYSDLFLAGLQPYECRAAFGLRRAGDAGGCAVLLQSLQWRDAAPVTRRPERRRVFNNVVLDSGHQQVSSEVSLPPPGDPAGRVVLTLTLGAPVGGIDPWDRAGSVYAWDDVGQRIEVLRFITPFGRPYQWKVDVSDFQSVLRGKRKMALSIGTWVKGWRVSVDLDYYHEPLVRQAFRVTNLWSGDWDYGNPADPLAAKFATRKLTLDPTMRNCKLRVLVTGHGMSPNTNNAAEFMPSKRTVTVNGTAFENTLWKTDNWLNPCRVQGGTWKFDRAGWGPGSICEPWEIDLTRLVAPGQPVTVGYKPDDYVNQNAGKSRACHIVEAQLVEYR